MNCDRAFISLIDSSTQYIIAEATRSISLKNVHSFTGPQDALFLGKQALNKEYGICPQSVAIFTDETASMTINTREVVANTTRYVIRDLNNLDQYKHCPYVVGFPHMVSYAEVPVKSASGHVLGTYCVMDNKVRDDFFHDSTIEILTDIAGCITEHMELHAIRQDCGRGVQMMRGLSEFIEGRRPDYTKGNRMEPPCANGLDASVGENVTRDNSPLPDSPQSYRFNSESTLSLDSSPQTIPSQNSSSSSSISSSFPSPGQLKTSQATVSVGQITGGAFSGAADLIRAAMDVEGLVLLQGSSMQYQKGYASSQSDPDPMEDSFDGQYSSSFCEVLGSSVLPKHCHSKTPQSALALHKSSLDYLIRSFPQGCVLITDDQVVYALVTKKASVNQAHPRQASCVAVKVPQELQMLITKARSLIFLPLWDSTRERFIVGMLGWSSDPTRVLDETDMTCLSAFGSTFMTELARSEYKELARAKSDFLSSVSHELRSPLHGIIAAIEFLQDPQHESPADLIAMVQSCASTLLDTLNHVLDFSKVNELTETKTRTRKDSLDDLYKPGQNAFGHQVEDDLCQLVQDVVEGVHFGQASRQAAFNKIQAAVVDTVARANPSTDITSVIEGASEVGITLSAKAADPVAVYVHLEPCPEWRTTLSVGAWKRLVMNLFGNAAKYTHQGFIEVSLRMITDPDNPTRKSAHLMVRDTGIGMSEEFVEHHLYQPFVQENPIADGTGLGLSIVHKIVQDLEGRIEVQSTPGAGTRFDVFIPLANQDDTRASCVSTGRQMLDPDAVLRGRTICLLSRASELPLQNLPAAQTELYFRRAAAMHSHVQAIAQEWLDMNTVLVQSPDEADADFLIAETSHVVDLVQANPALFKHFNMQRTILVDTIPSIRLNRYGLRDNFVKLTYPLGPKQLHRALSAALKVHNEPALLSANASTFLQTHQRPDEKEIVRNNDFKPSMRMSEQTGQNLESKIEVTHLENDQHFLLVDDNAINLKLFSTFIKRLGFSAETAENGLEAFEKYQASSTRKSFTTILMDINMPIMDGFTSSREIRNYEAKNPLLKPARIIALTGLGGEASRREAKSSGIDEFCTKPVAFKTLRGLLNA